MKYKVYVDTFKIVGLSLAGVYGNETHDEDVIESELSDLEILENYSYINGDLYYVGRSPGQDYELSLDGTHWVFNLGKGRLRKWAEIKQARTQAEYSGFAWDGSVFDSDATSQQRINGAVSLALIAKQASQPYSITWTLADNTLRVLSADDMISVGLALGTHVQATFNKGQQLQQQIEAATTREEIEVITW